MDKEERSIYRNDEIAQPPLAGRYLYNRNGHTSVANWDGFQWRDSQGWSIYNPDKWAELPEGF